MSRGEESGESELLTKEDVSNIGREIADLRGFRSLPFGLASFTRLGEEIAACEWFSVCDAAWTLRSRAAGARR